MANWLLKVFYIKSNKVMNRIIKNTVLAIALILIYSCDADDSGTEDTQPRFSFRISGDGFDRTFTQDDDLENIQLNLRHDADYDFIFSGGDTQGVKRIQMQYPTDYIEFTGVTPFPPNPWQQMFPSGSLSGIIFWEGDPSNPITGNILNGTLRPNGELVSIELYFRVEDFGGESGASNITDGSLNILIDNHNTEVITLN